MIDEEKGLRVRVDALRKFTSSNAIFERLDKSEQKRMLRQLCGMEIYLEALSQRLMISLGDY